MEFLSVRMEEETAKDLHELLPVLIVEVCCWLIVLFISLSENWHFSEEYNKVFDSPFSYVEIVKPLIQQRMILLFYITAVFMFLTTLQDI